MDDKVVPLNLEKIESLITYSDSRFDSGNREEIILKIEEITFKVISNLCSLRVCQISINKHGSERIVDFRRDASKVKFTNVIFVLSKVFQLLVTNKHSTKREIYYENVSRFKSQVEVDRALHDVGCLIKVPIWQLRIHGTACGLVFGPVSFIMADNTEVSAQVSGGIQVPDILLTEQISSCAKWILLIEKDAAFQKIVQDEFINRLGPVICITGKGFPDVNTRMAVCRLHAILRIPVFALVDADPYGIEIMCVYRFGSKSMNMHSQQLACPAVRWIGIHPSDISRLGIESQPLIPCDYEKATALLTRSVVSDNIQLTLEIEALIKGERKAEIEGVCNMSSNYLIDSYLPNKLMCAEYI